MRATAEGAAIPLKANKNKRKIEQMKKMKLAVGLMAITAMAFSAMAQDSGALVDQLVKKGVLSDQEGEEVRAELLKEFSKTSAGKVNLSDSVKSIKLSGDLRLRYEYRKTENSYPVGDGIGGSPAPTATFNTGTTGVGGNTPPNAYQNVAEQSHTRYRLRFGLTTKFAKDVEFGFRLATSGNNTMGAAGNATSSNMTLGDGFMKDSIGIETAYLKWNAYKDSDVKLTVLGGKFYANDAIYTSNMLWDGDIGVEGTAQKFSWKVLPKTELFINTLQLVYNNVNEMAVGTTATDIGNSWRVEDDGYILGGQLGVKHEFIEKTLSGKVAGGYWMYTNEQDIANANQSPTGWTWNNGAVPLRGGNAVGSGNIGMEFALIDVLGEVEYIPFKDGVLANVPFTVFGHYVLNTEAGFESDQSGRQIGAIDGNWPYNSVGDNIIADENYAFRAGMKVGHAKKKGQWELNGYYEMVKSDALPDQFNDSDNGNGFTNHEGITLEATYMLQDYWSVGVALKEYDWLNPTENNIIGNSSTLTQTRPTANNIASQSRYIQVDTSVKF